MARRDRIGELIAIKKRGGRRGGVMPSVNDVMQLKQALDKSPEPKYLFASLLPARITTLIEVFCRYWVHKLIDSGSPYAERAIDLKIDIKFDLPLVHSLQGKTITLGLLLSNSMSFQSIENIASIFS